MRSLHTALEGLTEIVDYDINDLVLLKNEWMRILAVDSWIGSILAGSHDCIDRRDLRRDV